MAKPKQPSGTPGTQPTANPKKSARNAPVKGQRGFQKKGGEGPKVPASPDIKKSSPSRTEGRTRNGSGKFEAFQPTDAHRNLVKLGKLNGFTHEQIAAIVRPEGSLKGIDVKTLEKYFAEELETGAQEILSRISGNLARLAMAGSDKVAVTAAIFMLKTRMRDAYGQDGTISGEFEFGAPGKKGKKGEAAGPMPVKFTLKLANAGGKAEGDEG